MTELIRTRAHDLALALRHYLAGAEEAARLQAYEVGRDAMTAGIGILQMVSEHQEALAVLLSHSWTPDDSIRVIKASEELVAECLGPFEMAHRGFQEAHASLLRVNADLERQIKEREQAEADARIASELADRANRAKSAFLSRMSHELRTPLNAVLGFGQLLEVDQLSEEQRESVHQILNGGKHLLDLINEALDIAGIEAGRIFLTKEQLPVEEVVLDAMNMIQPLAADRGVTLRAEVPADIGCVLADRRRTRQVLLNLLSNAVKYNRPNGVVIIGCRQEPVGWARIEVGDDGPGIAPQDVSRLFVPFERLGADGSGVEGTGLGLALSMDLARAMGGELGVESALGQGSTFWFALPLAGESGVEDQGPEVEPRPAHSAHDQAIVLHIDDDPAIRMLVKRILAARPTYQLMSVAQGSLGVELAQEHHPHLILMDLNLPDMSGKDVLRRLQSDPRTREIPVVVISGDNSHDGARRSLEAGAIGYLTKPFDVRHLLEVVDEAVTNGDGGHAPRRAAGSHSDA
jgi:signal transduction histidine kinase/CheY-like chemotaxis protein